MNKSIKDITKKYLKEIVLNLTEVSRSYINLSYEEQKKIFDDFVNKAKEVHSNSNYEYDFNKFSGMSRNFEVCCKIHDRCFNVIPTEHLKGKQTCKACDYWPLFISKVKDVPKYVDMGIEVLDNGNLLKIGNWEIKKENVFAAHERIVLYCTKHNKYFTPKAMDFYKKDNPSGGCKECNEEYKTQVLGISSARELYEDLKKYCSILHYGREVKSTKKFMRANMLLRKKSNYGGLIFDEEIIFNPDDWDEDKKKYCNKVLLDIAEGLESIGEKNVFDSLIKLGFNEIDIEKQFRINVDNRNLKMDFYLPKFNTYIEYDGEQHYRPVSVFGGEKGYAVQYVRDVVKNDYVVSNNVKLIRITYEADFNDIEEFLRQELNNTSNKGVIYFPKKPDMVDPIEI
jgi:hypothetical protein